MQKILFISLFVFFLSQQASAQKAVCNAEKIFHDTYASDTVLIQNDIFSGVEKFNLDKKLYFAFAGKYKVPQKGKSLVVIIFECNSGSSVQKAKFEFYGEQLDYLKYNKNKKKLYVVFKDSTELFGWVSYEKGNFKFDIFEDPEL